MVTIAYNNDPDLRSATLLAGGGEGGFWKCSCLGHENSALAASPTMSAAHGYSELKDLPCPKRQKARLLGQQSLELSCPGHAFPGSKRSTQRPNNRSRPMGNDRKTHAPLPPPLSLECASAGLCPEMFSANVRRTRKLEAPARQHTRGARTKKTLAGGGTVRSIMSHYH